MRTSTTMYELAKALALEEGPRIALDRLAGYYLTTEELRRLYAREGFYIDFSKRHIARENWPNQIDRWIYTGQAIKTGEFVFFLLTDSYNYDADDKQHMDVLQQFAADRSLEVIG